MSRACFVHGEWSRCIYFDMEKETILYYYPLPGRTDSANNTLAAKKHWFKEAALQTGMLTEQEEFCVLGCMVPPFYYRKKAWKASILSEVMATALHTAAGMTDTYVHPDILRLLGPEMWGRWQPREGTIKLLTKYLLEQRAGKTLAQTGMVTVLLGQSQETERQLATTWELLEPYLPRVNRMLIYYEGREIAQNTGGSEHAGMDDDQADVQEYLEDYYYEYGLVPQLLPYNRDRTAVYRCGKERCCGVILDYSDSFRYPKIASADCVFIDVASDSRKEGLLGRKSLAVPYVSPLKYLDTLVKNSYDRKVKMTSDIKISR